MQCTGSVTRSPIELFQTAKKSSLIFMANCDNLWDVNDGVELAEPSDRVCWVVSYLGPLVLSSYKVVVDPHKPVE